METWVDLPPGTDFPLANVPYGVFSLRGSAPPRVGVAIGDSVVDLAAVLGDARSRHPP